MDACVCEVRYSVGVRPSQVKRANHDPPTTTAEIKQPESRKHPPASDQTKSGKGSRRSDAEKGGDGRGMDLEAMREGERDRIEEMRELDKKRQPK